MSDQNNYGNIPQSNENNYGNLPHQPQQSDTAGSSQPAYQGNYNSSAQPPQQVQQPGNYPTQGADYQGTQHTVLFRSNGLHQRRRTRKTPSPQDREDC
ncbi:hypothetical protein [uncultured Rothia sp.]|mgnify:CR=1 FL=1|uniref:hypothetical protein n=1 Tax=uncultured Rothia sp. TaxID=316088 RepID=UPI003216E00C